MKQLLTLNLLLLQLASCIISTYAVDGRASSSLIDFIENKGQWDNHIRYKANLPGGVFFLTEEGFVYHFVEEKGKEQIKNHHIKQSEGKEGIINHHAYAVSFAGCNKAESYNAAKKRDYYHNYFIGNNAAKWKGNVGLYGHIVRKNLYDGIDMAVYSNEYALKYDFIVKPGADPGQIKLDFDGVVPQVTQEGQLYLKTTVNEIIEDAPFAYQMIQGRQVPVTCNYALIGQQLSFEFPNGYEKQCPLVIDPELIFSTFSGSINNSQHGNATTYDAAGNLYVGAVSKGIGWPVSIGAFQELYNAGSDSSDLSGSSVAINKYNATGTALIYSTYYGGRSSYYGDFTNDEVMTLIVNPLGALFIAGTTYSIDLPVTTGCFDSTIGGTRDLFVAHFNDSGTALIGATYIGGETGYEVQEDVNLIQNAVSRMEMALDVHGNIWIVASATTTDFPVTDNALQKSHSGSVDGILFQLKPTCDQLRYSTYLGGNHNDLFYGIQFNNEGNLVVCGETNSSDFPTTAGVIHPKAIGITGRRFNADGFVSIINASTGALVHSSYLGTNGLDKAYRIQVDPADNIYVMGYTLGDYPISSSISSFSGGDIFIDKLSKDLSTSLLSTRLGNPQVGSAQKFCPTGFLLDNCGNIYLAGIGADERLTVTPDALIKDPRSFWFGVWKPGFSELLFATYFGSTDGVDIVHEGVHRFDPQGALYQSICSASRSFPVTPGAAFPKKSIPGRDALSFKIAFQFSGVFADMKLATNQQDTGCLPFKVQFKNYSHNAQSYLWDFGDGSPLSADTHPEHIYTTAGSFTVSLYAYNDSLCKTVDTNRMIIYVFDPKMPDIAINDTLVCNYEEQISLQVYVHNPNSNHIFSWQPNTGILGPDNGPGIAIQPGLANTYYVTVWDTIPGFCGFSKQDSIHVDYKPRMLTIANEDTLVCLGTQIQVRGMGSDGYTYQWSPALGVSDPLALNPILNPEQSTTYSITASYPGCADTTQSIQVTVDHPFWGIFSMELDSICVGETIQFYPLADSTTMNLHWQFGDGTEMTSDKEMKIQHAYETAGHLPVRLSAHFRVCPISIFTDTIHVYALPLVNLGSDTALCLSGGPIVLKNQQPAETDTYHNLWNTGDTSAGIKIVQPGIYSLTITNEPLGCSATSFISITKDCFIDMPNVFTPNGDGSNDYFFPRQLLSQNVYKFRMQILNRWGQALFETKNIDGRGWDGRFNGKEQPAGVYIYLIEVEFEGSRQEQYKGNVTIIR